MTARAARTGPLVRFVLLACTLVGLAAMHSLGHDPAPPTTGTGAHTAAMPAPAGQHDDCAGDGCAQAITAPASHDGHMPSWAVCLAILGAFTLTIALGLALLTETKIVRSGLRPTVRAAWSRGPPARLIGLHLASVSVQRT
ncbi:hypothetical protein [Micromonospora sp. NPDC005413]|uniref:hypothetical protein n=1 Tax=Micromonospora sp. NPDC005413 TaxID=3154563 RepID=UPI0033BF90E4